MPTLEINWMGMFPDEIEVEEGVLNEDALDAYSYGNCHALALAFHYEYGFELYAAYELYEDGDVDERPFHILVRTDEGLFLDIRGEQEGIVLEEKYGCELRAISADDVQDLVDEGYLVEPDLDLASTFVGALMKGEVHV